MKITGIIAEYNPFHNGHKHQLEQIRKNGTDYIVVIMSGDWVQRGTPALVDKYKRTQMALKAGADLVLELPVAFSTAASRDFAFGGVSIFNALGCITELSFGCETNNIEEFNLVADILTSEPDDFSNKLIDYLKSGLSFPKARELALCDYLPDANLDFIKKPNNILALEYCLSLKKLSSKIIPAPVLREGSDFNDSKLPAGSISSATAIRSNIFSNISTIKEYVPSYVYDILSDSILVKDNAYDRELRYKLLSTTDYSIYKDVSETLSNKIRNNLYSFTNTTDFINILKSKDITYSHISRSLCHILLNITKDYNLSIAPEYVRMLGFRKSSSELLSEIKKNSTIKLISKLADASSLLNEPASKLLNLDINASHLYSGINEYTRGIIIE